MSDDDVDNITTGVNVDEWCDTHGEPRMSMKDFHAEEERAERKAREAPLRSKSIEWVRVDRGYGTGIRVTFIKSGQRKSNEYFPSDMAIQSLLDTAGETVAHVEDSSIFLEIYPRKELSNHVRP